MRNTILAIITLGIILSGCSNSQDKTANSITPARGGVNYGGVFRFNLKNDYRSLFPHSIVESSAWYINDQIYEGLVDVDPASLAVKPHLAESWSFDEAKNAYTFKIRKGVYFRNDSCFEGGKGRELNANDVKYCFDLLCTANPTNLGFSYTLADIVIGANEHYRQSAMGNLIEGGVSGITVEDDFTIKVKLKNPHPDFLKILSTSFCWIFPKEAYEKYGLEMNNRAIGTGPFYIASSEKGNHVQLKRNENYWKIDEHGNQLPYLDGILISFMSDKRVELLEFKKGNLDMVSNLPVAFINNFFGEFNIDTSITSGYQVHIQPGLNTSFLAFNQNNVDNIFQDKNV
ncbi:MAG: ABC transporter substrate-binding protein, partial [Flavobacteriales bacterium]|nr:ABC transporter substrate-binding protein [Flavobacteriales bacterium]